MNPRSSNIPANRQSRNAAPIMVGFLARENEIPSVRLP